MTEREGLVRIKQEIEREKAYVYRMLNSPDGKIFCEMLLRDVVRAKGDAKDGYMAMRMLGERNLANRILDMAQEEGDE